MKFSINKIYLWLKFQKEPRTLTFEPNKVNVITGGSGTGKSSILSIIDYCLLSSDNKIVEEIINENVLWYGLDFKINNKHFFIARRTGTGNQGSEDVYFSSIGEVPVTLEKSINIAELKSILEGEFNIDEKLIIPYGGKKIKAGSKISFRYFLLFNTLSEDIIASSNIFFDYDLQQDREKYKEALDRIFDLVIGIDTVDNVLIKEQITKLDKQILQLEKKQKLFDREYNAFSNNIIQLAREAQEYDLIERQLLTVPETLARLKSLVQEFRMEKISSDLKVYEELNSEKRNITRKIRNLRSFERELNRYQESINKDYDSVKPIEYIERNFEEIIPTSDVGIFLQTLKEELHTIKESIGNKQALSINVGKQIKKLEDDLKAVNEKLSKLPAQSNDFKNEIHKYIFIGELKAKLAFYQKGQDNTEESFDTSSLTEERSELENKLSSSGERARAMYEVLHERIERNIKLTHSLGVYQNYKPFIDLKGKTLKLRPPNSANPKSIGSKSNHMFLHLFFFLGLHEHIISENVKFVPQYLILDQPSQPYYEAAEALSQDKLVDDDKSKLIDAFSLLNKFIGYVSTELKDDFQIILLEHAPPEYWTEANLENFHLVEEFRHGNALIPIGIQPDNDELPF